MTKFSENEPVNEEVEYDNDNDNDKDNEIKKNENVPKKENYNFFVRSLKKNFLRNNIKEEESNDSKRKSFFFIHPNFSRLNIAADSENRSKIIPKENLLKINSKKRLSEVPENFVKKNIDHYQNFRKDNLDQNHAFDKPLYHNVDLNDDIQKTQITQTIKFKNTSIKRKNEINETEKETTSNKLQGDSNNKKEENNDNENDGKLSFEKSYENIKKKECELLKPSKEKKIKQMKRNMMY